MNITHIDARSGVALRRALKLSALGAFAVSGLACGGFSNPTTTGPQLGSGGSTSDGGSTSVAGFTDTTGASGSFTTGGGSTGTVGGSTGIAGDTSGAGATSTGGATSTEPFCSPLATPVQPRVPLPFAVTTAFTPSGYEGGDASMSGGGQISSAACTDRAPGAIGACTEWIYTPATPATWAGVAYIRGYQSFGSAGHPQLCLADGATAITFYAKGAVGGETVGFAGGTAPAVDFTLTASWTLYTIPISGLAYNTDATGLEDGFFWKVAPPATGPAVAESFYVDDIQFVGATGGGGAGGAAGTGGGVGTGGGAGASAAGAAGSGGSGGAAAGSGGSGGA